VRRKRTSGIAIVAVFALLAATGYAPYDLVNDGTPMGIALAAMLLAHLAPGLRDA
jgi:hypothetical protein